LPTLLAISTVRKSIETSEAVVSIYVEEDSVTVLIVEGPYPSLQLTTDPFLPCKPTLMVTVFENSLSDLVIFGI
jgi:hypothetical protein